MANVHNQPLTVRGYLRLIEPTEFRIETGPALYTTIQLKSVVQMRKISRRALKQRRPDTGAPLAYTPMGYINSPDKVLTAAAAGVVIAGLQGAFSGPGKAPSAYQGWVFEFRR